MANETYTIPAEARATTIVDTPTMHLRWNNGILEQFWNVEEHEWGKERTHRSEWRPVPVVPQKEDGE